jgi:hypothetical protein
LAARVGGWPDDSLRELSKDGLTKARIGVTTIDGEKPTLLDVFGTAPLGVVDGHLFYVNFLGSLMAVPVDLKARRTTGPPIALVEGIQLNPVVGAARVALADNGTLVYLSAGTTTNLVVADLAGNVRPLLPQSAGFSAPSWSRERTKNRRDDQRRTRIRHLDRGTSRRKH